MHRTHLLQTRNLGTSQGEPRFTFTHANPLAPDFASAIEPNTHTVAWAGWFDEGADPAEANFPSDHRLWTTGLDELRQSLASLTPVLVERDAYLSLRPACGLVLSDPHSASALLKEPPSDRLRILVDPVAMLTPEMASHAEDHLPRMLDKLGNSEACTGIVLAGGEAVSEDRMAHRPLDTSRAFDNTLLDSWRDSAFAGRDVFVLTEACRDLIERVRIA
ncbi:MAG: hypothetical protein KDA31_12825 [Phycisphaerales bacterium]|nr:hypothetical protein [Phycisphaerales bacterium]MCB9836664.1 hypothetical protein [Phycisphaera sp.]